jgi:hypothetical protein
MALMFIAPQALLAQMARMTGTVTDKTGGVVSGANISIRNVATGTHREGITSSAGDYDVSQLQPGNYTVRVEKDGFEALQRSGITLSVGTTTRVDLELSLGHVNEAISVNGNAGLLQPDNPEDSLTIDSRRYDTLPLVQQGRIRAPTAFLFLAPGVQGNYTLNGGDTTGATNMIQVNGSPTVSTEMYLDGLPMGPITGWTTSGGLLTESEPPVDAVGEFKLTATSVPADYGHTGAAVGAFGIKSGTNEFHGTVYEYFRNNALDANTWLGNHRTTPFHPPTRQNEFGVTIGGPIEIPHIYQGKNRTFFFFSYGGSRKSGVDSVTTVHIPDAQQLQGNFAGQATIYDPATTTVNASGQVVRTPFPDNIIPKERIDPIAKQIAAFYPQVVSIASQNFSGVQGEKHLNPDILTAKVDHSFNEKHSLSGTFVATRNPRLRVDNPLPTPLTAGIDQLTSSKSVRLNENWVISPSSLNTATIGYNRYINDVYPVYPTTTPFVTIPGLVGNVFPALSFSGYQGVGSNPGSLGTFNVFQFRDTFSWSISKHTLRAGAEYRYIQFNSILAGSTGTMSFSPTETSNPSNPNGTGDAVASFLLGQVDTGNLSLPSQVAMRDDYAGFFVQDDWRPTQKLTVNVGLRWELQTVPTENANRSSIVDLGTSNPAAGNLPGALIFAGTGTGRSGQAAFLSTNSSGVGPRFGVSYLATHSTTLRGGYGIYYYDLGLSINNNGFGASASYSPIGNAPAFALQSGFPDNPGLHPPTLSPSLLNNSSATYLAPTANQLPRIQEWTASIQQALGANTMIELAYIGNHGTRLWNQQMSNINQLNPKYLSLGTLLSQPATSAAAVQAGITLPYPGFTGTVAQALQPYPQYRTLTSESAKVGASRFNALEATLKKRLSHGLSVEANYTWSKNMGYFSPSYDNESGVTNVMQNAYDPHVEWSLLPTDATNTFVVSYSYELPFGRGREFVANSNSIVNQFISGWGISGIQRYQSGFPLGILMSSNSLSSTVQNYVLRPNIVPGVDPATHIKLGKFIYGTSSLINSAAFQAPAAFTFGSARPTYGDLKNFPIYTEDLSGIKHFKVREGLNWDFYGQAFNVFNRHRFTGISTAFGSSTFGQPSGVSFAREIQIGTRIRF